MIIQYIENDLSKPLSHYHNSKQLNIFYVSFSIIKVQPIKSWLYNESYWATKKKDTQKLMQVVIHFLIYAESNHTVKIIYHKSDILYRVDSDTAYLICPDAHSRA